MFSTGVPVPFELACRGFDTNARYPNPLTVFLEELPPQETRRKTPLRRRAGAQLKSFFKRFITSLKSMLALT
jgi:hypothetical protein